MKKIIIFSLVCCAIAGGGEGGLILIGVFGMFWLIARILGKLGILSAPTRMSNAAGNEVRRAYNRSVVMDLLRRYLH